MGDTKRVSCYEDFRELYIRSPPLLKSKLLPELESSLIEVTVKVMKLTESTRK